MKRGLRCCLELFGYGALLLAPGIIMLIIFSFAPCTIWSRMENETEEHYQQRMQLQALAFKARSRL